MVEEEATQIIREMVLTLYLSRSPAPAPHAAQILNFKMFFPSGSVFVCFVQFCFSQKNNFPPSLLW